MAADHPAWELVYGAVGTLLAGEGVLRDRLTQAWREHLSTLHTERLMEEGDPGWEAWLEVVRVFDDEAGLIAVSEDSLLPAVAERVLDVFMALETGETS